MYGIFSQATRIFVPSSVVFAACTSFASPFKLGLAILRSFPRAHSNSSVTLQFCVVLPLIAIVCSSPSHCNFA